MFADPARRRLLARPPALARAAGYLEFSFNSATGPTAEQAQRLALFGYVHEAAAPAEQARRLQAAPTVTTVSPEFHVSLTMMHRVGNLRVPGAS